MKCTKNILWVNHKKICEINESGEVMFFDITSDYLLKAVESLFREREEKRESRLDNPQKAREDQALEDLSYLGQSMGSYEN